jgi:hypothetical protein
VPSFDHEVLVELFASGRRRALEALMITNYEYKSEFARRYIAQGREQGREEGSEQTRRDDVLQLARLRVGEISDADEQRTRATSLERVGALFLALASAPDAEAARTALRRWLDTAVGP